jgi:hypothetical protein
MTPCTANLARGCPEITGIDFASARLPGGMPDAIPAGITTAVWNRISSHRAVKGSH